MFTAIIPCDKPWRRWNITDIQQSRSLIARDVIKEAEALPLMEIPRRFDIHAVTIHTKMEDLIAHALNQNFVPVVDDRGVFIGIITRKKIIQYLSDQDQKLANSMLSLKKEG